MKKTNNIINDLRTEAIKERHWKSILNTLSIKKSINEMKLGDFWNANLSSKEKKLNEKLHKINKEKKTTL